MDVWQISSLRDRTRALLSDLWQMRETAGAAEWSDAYRLILRYEKVLARLNAAQKATQSAGVQ